MRNAGFNMQSSRLQHGCLFVQIKQNQHNPFFNCFKIEPHHITISSYVSMSLSLSSRSHFSLMTTEWITCRWMRRRLRHCKTPKWSGQMFDSQKHNWKMHNENMRHTLFQEDQYGLITPARRTDAIRTKSN